MPPHVTLVIQQDQPGWLVLLQVLGFLVQVASLIFLAIYVLKTIQIAKANQHTAEVASANLRLSEQSLLETRSLRELQTAPNVVVYLEVNGWFVNLVVENIGQGIAREVRLTIEPSLATMLPKGLDEPAFARGIPFDLAPRQKLTCFINSILSLPSDGDKPLRYDVDVRHPGEYAGSVQNHKFTIDFDNLKGAQLEGNHVEDAVSKLEAIANNLATIAEKVQLRIDDESGLDLVNVQWLRRQTSEESVASFRKFVLALDSDWRSVCSHAESGRYLPSRVMRNRLQFSLSNLVTSCMHIPISDDLLDRISALTMDLEAEITYAYRRGFRNREDITRLIKELTEISDALGDVSNLDTDRTDGNAIVGVTPKESMGQVERADSPEEHNDT